MKQILWRTTIVLIVLSAGNVKNSVRGITSYLNPVTTKDNVTLYLFNRSSSDSVANATLANVSAVTNAIDKNKELIIYIHGRTEVFDSYPNIYLKNVILEKSDANVILVEWLSYCVYDIYCINNVVCASGTFLGEYLLDFAAQFNYSLDNVTLIGFSMGAHFAGCAGRAAQSKVGKCIGLDPAGPLYLESVTNNRLNTDCGSIVEAIHCTNIIGVPFNVGDSDFWINGGCSQPACLSLANITNPSCPHSVCVTYYRETILNGSFTGVSCPTFYLECTVTGCSGTSTARVGGLSPDISAKGPYYVTAVAEAPYMT